MDVSFYSIRRSAFAYLCSNKMRLLVIKTIFGGIILLAYFTIKLAANVFVGNNPVYGLTLSCGILLYYIK